MFIIIPFVMGQVAFYNKNILSSEFSLSGGGGEVAKSVHRTTIRLRLCWLSLIWLHHKSI